jgi:YXWGXW repeat-containing protein
MVRLAPRVRPRRRLGPILGLLPMLLPVAACGDGVSLPGGEPPPDGITMAQNQPPQVPRSMAPPPPPSRPPSPRSTDFGHWQLEGNHFRWTPGQHPGPSGQAPVWAPGHWYTDANGNRVWVPGYWR